MYANFANIVNDNLDILVLKSANFSIVNTKRIL